MPVSVVRDRLDPRQLSANITSASGRQYRWGADEADAADVPAGVRITTRLPGGFATFDCTLNRRPDLSYNDLDRFAPLTCYGMNGAQVAFDGYLSASPFDRTSSFSFSPEAIGWSGTMKDDSSFSMIYIDRQLSRWAGWSNQRLLNNLSAGFNCTQFSDSVLVDPTSGHPAMSITGQGQLVQSPIFEAWYDAGANNTIQVVRIPAYQAIGYGFPDANNTGTVFLCSDDVATSFQNLASFASASGSVNASGTPQRFGLIQHRYLLVAPAGTNGVTYGYTLENISVLGPHGLTLRQGPSGTTADDGFNGADIIGDIISRACPLLNFTTGSSGSIVQDSFVVPHLVLPSATTADAGVQQVNQFYLNDYGVYEGRQFFWRPPGTGRTWHARLGDGTQLTDQGPQIETAFNNVVVQYADPAGASRTVGPPPASWDQDPATGATNSTLLQDTSASNPCNVYGRKRVALLQMGTTTWAGAVQVGAIFLRTTSQRPTSGTAVIKGTLFDSNGREWPAWMIRAGDTVILDDTSDQTPRYILETNYDHDSLSNTLTLDAPPNKLDWLLQRLNVAIAPLG